MSTPAIPAALSLPTRTTPLRLADTPATLPSHALGQLAPEDLVEAAHEYGAFVLTDHGVRREIVADVLDLARLFFAQPVSDKETVEAAASPQLRGWTAFDAGSDEGWREEFSFGAELPAIPAAARRHEEEALVGPNQWPARVPALRNRALWMQDRLTEVSRAVLRQLGVGLGLAGDYFDRALAGHPVTWTTIARDGGRDGRSFDIRSHTDSPLITLRWLSADGLQVRTGRHWSDVAARPDAFLVTFGEPLAEATHGRVAAARHRLIPSEGERVTLTASLDVPYGGRL